MSNLKIGDEIYRYVAGSGVWNYVVEGVHKYENTTQYIVECQPCSHGWKCKLLVTDDNGKLRFSSLVNYDEDDNQSYWHNGAELFKTDKQEARLDMLNRSKKTASEAVTKMKEKLKTAEQRKCEIDVLVDECKKMIEVN